MATLIAVLIAMFTFGLNRGRSMDQINDTLTSSIKIIAMMLLIIGGGGAFKQVLVDSGMDKYIAPSCMKPTCRRCLWPGLLPRYCVLRWVLRPLQPSPQADRAADCHHRRQPGTDGYRRRFR
jgi:hypothetical protein